MGTEIEINDTLQITRKQGFPTELDLEKHKKIPFTVEDFKDQVFEFKDKTGIRIYKAPPVRVFLVENRDGKWIYWGLIHVLEIKHDYAKKMTSGKYKIIHIYSPDQMPIAHQLIDRNKDTDFFQIME